MRSLTLNKGMLMTTAPIFDLTKSHSARRIFFVGTNHYDSIPRIESNSNPHSKTKTHGLWTFVHVPDWRDPNTIVEIPLLNWLMGGTRPQLFLKDEAVNGRRKNVDENPGGIIHRVD